MNNISGKNKPIIKYVLYLLAVLISVFLIDILSHSISEKAKETFNSNWLFIQQGIYIIMGMVIALDKPFSKPLSARSKIAIHTLAVIVLLFLICFSYRFLFVLNNRIISVVLLGYYFISILIDIHSQRQ